MLKTLVTTTVLALSLSACAAYKTEEETKSPEYIHKSTTVTTDHVVVDGNGYYETAPTNVVVQKETYAPNGDRIIVRDHYQGTDQVIFNESYPYYGKLKYSQGR